MTKKITETALKNLAPGAQLNCSELRGLRARCLPSGLVKLGFRYTHNGVQHEINLGLHGKQVTLAEARKRAMAIAAEAVAKVDPLAKLKTEQARARHTVNYVLDQWLADARKRGVKTADVCERDFARLLRPALGDKVIYHPELKRSEVEGVLQAIEEQHGRAMAVKAHGELRAVFRWWKGKDDEFQSDPVPTGWTAGPCRERALSDEEVRDVWLACDEMDGVFPVIVKMLLVTGLRRMEVGAMAASEVKRDDLHGDYIEIDGKRMKKGKAHLVPITPAIAALIPQGKPGLLFTAANCARQGYGRDTLFAGWGYSKRQLDAVIARARAADGRGAMPEWCLHDLRRTVRTGLSALGVNRDVGERVLAHVEGGVRGIYDKYGFYPEKREALTKWAAHVERIVHGLTNVVALAAAGGGRVAGLGG